MFRCNVDLLQHLSSAAEACQRKRGAGESPSLTPGRGSPLTGSTPPGQGSPLTGSTPPGQRSPLTGSVNSSLGVDQTVGCPLTTMTLGRRPSSEGPRSPAIHRHSYQEGGLSPAQRRRLAGEVAGNGIYATPGMARRVTPPQVPRRGSSTQVYSTQGSPAMGSPVQTSSPLGSQPSVHTPSPLGSQPSSPLRFTTFHNGSLNNKVRYVHLVLPNYYSNAAQILHITAQMLLNRCSYSD